MNDLDRITYSGAEFTEGFDTQIDEIVLTGVTVHLESLNSHQNMLIIQHPDGRYVHLNVADVWVVEQEGCDDLMRQIEAANYDCGFTWENSWTRHTCTEPAHHDGSHKCDCDSRRKEGR